MPSSTSSGAPPAYPPICTTSSQKTSPSKDVGNPLGPIAGVNGPGPSPRGGIPVAVSDGYPAPHPPPSVGGSSPPSFNGLANSTRGFRPQPFSTSIRTLPNYGGCVSGRE